MTSIAGCIACSLRFPKCFGHFEIFQDEQFATEYGSEGMQRNRRAWELNCERKQAILREAIEKNPEEKRLQLRRVMLAKEIMSGDELNKEWLNVGQFCWTICFSAFVAISNIIGFLGSIP